MICNKDKNVVLGTIKTSTILGTISVNLYLLSLLIDNIIFFKIKKVKINVNINADIYVNGQFFRINTIDLVFIPLCINTFNDSTKKLVIADAININLIFSFFLFIFNT